ncbi:uncharacterized protein LOC106662584 [Cimex lectularius]|uniref:Uncharacterized protein n=1 Tax=Cimex lectularius TaxID=79782 RepID=A0A8I6TBZ4_CIMLE|nr:uncharacterized protein LOC106662584 [Cimex lectularius]
MWTPVTPKNDGNGKIPCSRSKHSVTLYGNHLYLIAGRNGNIPLKDLWRYSLSDGIWEQLDPSGDKPPNLQEHTAVAYKDSIYVFGGEVGFSACNEAPLWVYNVKNNNWRKVRGGKGATVPKGRRGHSALVHRSTMVIYGGYRDLKGSCNELWVFHFETESWHLLSNGRVSPPARHKHSMVIHDSSIWIFGGMTDLQERSDLWRFDTVRKLWLQVKCKVQPGSLHSHATCKLLSSMLIFGGERAGQANNELWRFHFATETWEKLTLEGLIPQPRSESVALTVPELLLQGNNCISKCSPKRVRSGSSIERQVKTRSSLNHRPNTTPTASNLSILKEISKLSQINLTRLGQSGKCNYSVLSSTESISETSLVGEMVKSQSHHIIAKSLISPTTSVQPTLPRDPISVPNFSSLASCTLTPVEVTKLVYLDDEEAPSSTAKQDFFSIHQQLQPKTRKGFPKSASVRFGNPLTTPEENCDETSDYASIETMNRISSSCNFEKTKKENKEGPYSFSNPNYMGPDIKEILSDNEYVKTLNSPPDSVLEDAQGRSNSRQEMIELKPIPPKSLPLALNSYNSQMNISTDRRVRASSATRTERETTKFCVFIIGGKERGQVTVFKRPISIWKLQLNPTVY